MRTATIAAGFASLLGLSVFVIWALAHDAAMILSEWLGGL